MNQMHKYGFLLFWLCCYLQPKAQAVFCPTNIDFESGNLNGWYLYTGTCCPIVTNVQALNPVTNRHTLISGPGFDPYGGFPIKSPGEGIYSLKLGNSATGSQAERARYYVRIPANLDNYSLVLRYAVVLEDGGHNPLEQPRFEAKAYDSASNAPINCIQFNFVASSSIPGFLTSSVDPDVSYKPWSTATINLSGMNGRTIALDFASGDCDPGAHFGYGYVDLDCSLFAIENVVCGNSPTSTMSAPPGFQFYHWYDSTFTTLLGINRFITINTPVDRSRFHVVMTPYPGFGCLDTLTTVVRVSDLLVQSNADTSVCTGGSVLLQNLATARAEFQPLQYSWTPTTGLSCTTCLNPVVSPITTTQYVFSVRDASGCLLRDTTIVNIGLNIQNQHSSAMTVCPGKTLALSHQVNGLPPINYQWFKNNVPIPPPLGNNDTLYFTGLNATDSGSYRLSANNVCGSANSITTKLSLYGLPQIVAQPVSKTACTGQRIVFRTYTSVPVGTPVTRQWYRNNMMMPGKNTDSLVINLVTSIDSGIYYMRLISPCDTLYTDTVSLSISPSIAFVQQPVTKLACLSSRVVMRALAIGNDSITYQWKRNGIPISGETNDSLVIEQLDTSHLKNYEVLATGICSNATSATVTIIPITKPIISLQPVPVTICNGKRMVLKTKASSNGSIRYRWQKNGLPLSTPLTDSLVINAISFADTGLYSAIVMGVCDTVYTDTVRVRFPEKPVFIQQPLPLSVCLGNPGSLISKRKPSTDTQQVRWRKNSIYLGGANTDTLAFTAVNFADSGMYQIIAYGQCDTVSSDAVRVSPRYLQILRQPTPLTTCLRSNASFSIQTHSTDPVTYTWKKDTFTTLLESNDTLHINNITYRDTGMYAVSVSMACDTQSSVMVPLRTFAPTRFTKHPATVRTCVSVPVTLRARATGTGVVTYQWYKNGAPLPGAVNDSLIVTQNYFEDTSDTYQVYARSFCDSLISAIAYVNLFPFTHPDLPDSIYICRNNAQYHVPGFDKYTWSNGDTTAFTWFNTDGPHYLTVTDANSCMSQDTSIIKLKDIPYVYAGPDTTICNEVQLLLKGNASRYHTLRWLPIDFGAIQTPDSIQTLLRILSGTTGKRNAVLHTGNECGINTDTITIDLKNRTLSTFTPSDTVVCELGASIALKPVQNFGYFSGPFVNVTNFIPAKHGLYEVRYHISQYGCTDSSSQLIRVVPQPVSSFRFTPEVPNLDSLTRFTATSIKTLNYVWMFEDKSATGATVAYLFKQEGLNLVKLVSINEFCYDTASRMIYTEGSARISIPNAFTPNGDGINEVFKVVYLNQKGGYLRIYNRWGDLIYESKDLNQGWDGTYKGEPCQDDTYIYIVEYIDNNERKRNLKGTVTLIR